MRKFVIALLSLVLLVGCCGCKGSSTAVDANGGPTDSRFKTIEHGRISGNSYPYSVVVDTNTGVMYLQVGYSDGVGLTPLLEKDGTPKLFTGDV